MARFTERIKGAAAWAKVFTSANAIAMICNVGMLVANVMMARAQLTQIEDARKAQIESSKRAAEDLAPRPVILAPLERFSFVGDVPGQVPAEAKLKLANIGKGNCYDLSAKAIVTQMRASGPDGSGSEDVPVDREADAKTLFSVSSITLPAGERITLDNFPIPCLADMPNPQAIIGQIQFQCRDENGEKHFFVQPFLVIIHLTEGDPHGHFNFTSAYRVPNPF